MNAHLKGHAFSPSLVRIFFTHARTRMDTYMPSRLSAHVRNMHSLHTKETFQPLIFAHSLFRCSDPVPQSQSVLVLVNLYFSRKSFFTKDFYGHKCLTLIFVVWLFVQQDGAERRSEETNSDRSRKTSFQAVLALGMLIKFPECLP